MKAKDAASDQPVQEPATVFSQPAADLVRAVMVGTLQQQEMQDALWDARLAETGLAGYGGTAYGFTDAWYIGSDKNITCAVWVGYDDGRPIGKVAFSRDTAFPLWAEVMTVATGGRPQGWPPSEEGPALCLRSGAAATEACVHKERRLVVSGAVPTPGTSCDYHKETPEVAQAALGAGEIVKAAKTARKQEREEPVGVSPVKPQEPVVVGADIYRSIKPPAKTVE